MKAQFKISFCLILCCFSSGNLFAQGVYIGASYLDNDSQFQEFEESDDGTELRLGFKFTDYISADVAYVDLGEFSFDNFAGTSGRVESEAYTANFIANWPLGPVNIYGKLGYLWWDREGEITTFFGPERIEIDGGDPLYGIGIEFNFGSHFSIKADYNESDDFDWTTFGVNFYF